VTDAMINEETTLLEAAEAEEAKTRPLVITNVLMYIFYRKLFNLGIFC